MKNKFILQLIFILCVSADLSFGQDSLIFSDIDGVIAVEAEHFHSQELTTKRFWYKTKLETAQRPLADADPNHASTASNNEYIEILPDTRQTHSDPLVVGTSFSNDPGVLSILSYKVNFTKAGKYYAWVRAYSTGTEDNGIHIGIDGEWPESGQRMQWCDGKNQWYWESKQRSEANHCGEPYKIYLTITEPGIHTVTFSMREDGFEFDKWILTTDRNYRPIGYGPDEFIITDITQSSITPLDFYLNPNFPNPFNPSTTISFGIKKSSNIDLSIYSINGELVKKLIKEFKSAGNYQIHWDGRNYYGNKVSSGVYLSKLLIDDLELTNKMILSK